MSNPVDDYLETKDVVSDEPAAVDGFRKCASEKKASFWRGVGQSLIAGGVVIGAEALYDAAKAARHAGKKQKHFKDMLRGNADLAQGNRDNPNMFNRHYTSLHSMNPQFAADPLVAGAYMRQMEMNPATAGNVVVESIQGASKMPRRQSMSPMQALQSGQRFIPPGGGGGGGRR